MPNPTSGKSPQERKAEKLRQELEDLTGIRVGNGQRPPGIAASKDVASRMAELLHDAIITGRRYVNPDNEDSPINCNAEWHFARYNGAGSSVVPLLFGISWHLAKDSGWFKLSAQKLAKFLNVKADAIYAAEYLLVTDGFWVVTESENGKPVKYQPIGHGEWAVSHPNRCTKKLDMNYVQTDPDLAEFGRKLHIAMGGEKFTDRILLSYRKKANSLTDDQVVERAKQFMAGDAKKGSGRGRQMRFGNYLLSLESEDS